MKTLVVGGGSIGARHLHNFKAAHITELALVEPWEKRRAELCGDDVVGLATLEQGLHWGPELVVIASPNHLHVEQALAAARHGCHLFIEKPLSHTSESLPELAREVEQRGLVSLVGCNMRFHPGPAMVQSLLGQGRIGRILFARIHTGSYLPNWRPRQDYTQSYSAKSAMGGGCILDCIHELDLARWYLGEVDEVYCVAEHLSSLHIDVEDVAMLVCRHRDGMLSEIHLDYVQHTYERGCQIVGEQGAIFWDFARGEVRLFDADGDVWETFAQPEGWEINQMYIDELHHLLACLRGEVTSTLPIPEALDVMRLALGAKASARAGTPVKTRSVF